MVTLHVWHRLATCDRTVAEACRVGATVIRTTTENVIEMIANELNVAGYAISSQTDLANDLGVDSIDRLGLAIRIEETFGIRVADESLRRLQTVGDMIDLIEARPA